ncbi:MAG: transporter permease [Frankiales bacterium]|jgi:peptide/nickel transport system permease protein|nr:transporter permease [Frankiales bacterium]MCW2586566.1 transporter permease [Frankiales bacterium]
MLRLLGRRLLVGIVVVFLVATAVFIATRVVSNPEKTFLPIDASPEQRVQIRSNLGLDRSVFIQYLSYLGDLVRLDLGTSYWQPGKTTVSIIMTRLPNTLLLNSAAIVLALLIAIPLGIIAALRPGSRLDRSAVTVSLIGLSAPQFWLAFMLVLLLGVKLQWFPTSGFTSAQSLLLPALALALPAAGKITQLTRSSMIDEMDRPYMLTAEAKGFGAIYRVVRHGLRNVTVPVLTQASFEYARMLAGFTVVVESIFAWPGVGLLIVQALEQQDLILVQAIAVVVAAMIVLLNTLTDLLYTRIDPRIEAT